MRATRLITEQSKYWIPDNTSVNTCHGFPVVNITAGSCFHIGKPLAPEVNCIIENNRRLQMHLDLAVKKGKQMHKAISTALDIINTEGGNPQVKAELERGLK